MSPTVQCMSGKGFVGQRLLRRVASLQSGGGGRGSPQYNEPNPSLLCHAPQHLSLELATIQKGFLASRGGGNHVARALFRQRKLCKKAQFFGSLLMFLIDHLPFPSWSMSDSFPRDPLRFRVVGMESIGSPQPENKNHERLISRPNSVNC